MNNYIVVMGGGKNSILVINKIHELGLKAIVVDRNPNAPGMAYADEKIILSTYESKPIIRELIKFQNNRRKIVATVVRSSGIPVITAAEISDALNLPGPGVEAAKILTYKDLFTEFCVKQNIPTARIEVSDPRKLREQIINYLPCVIKPTLGTVGKKGVILIQKESEINSAIKNAEQASLDGNIHIEKYIPGIDIGLISMIYEGMMYPCFFLRELNEFDEDGKVNFKGFYWFNDVLKNTEKNKIIKIVQRIAEATNIRFSPFLISLRLMDDGKAIPVEVNLDFGGENVLDEIIPAKTNFDFIECYLESIIYKTKPKIIL